MKLLPSLILLLAMVTSSTSDAAGKAQPRKRAAAAATATSKAGSEGAAKTAKPPRKYNVRKAPQQSATVAQPAAAAPAVAAKKTAVRSKASIRTRLLKTKTAAEFSWSEKRLVRIQESATWKLQAEVIGLRVWSTVKQVFFMRLGAFTSVASTFGAYSGLDSLAVGSSLQGAGFFGASIIGGTYTYRFISEGWTKSVKIVPKDLLAELKYRNDFMNRQR